ncbi:MAG TPA: hypothetical protein VJ023_16865 [Pyrinomonadaceae bacterium]|nr:hypothetical protein [Pyrinomonadaceae bacterium]
MVNRRFLRGAMALVLFSMVMVPAPVRAQSSGTNLFVSVNPTTVSAGEWAGVSGVVINDSTVKVRITVTFTAYDPCGTKTDLGYNRLALGPGQSVLVTTAYPTKASSCRGTHSVTMSTGGRKGSPGASATAYLEVE